jgi:small-conductance mechanosensitive channel
MQKYLSFHLFNVAGTEITIETLAIFAFILLVSYLISFVIRGAITKALKLRKIADEGSIGVTRRLTHYLIMFIGLGVGLQTIGINLNALFAAGAVFAVAIGFAMQNITQNFVSGLILLIERTIKPGDILKVENQLVRVSNLGIRATVARTLDDEEIIIPNSVLVQNSVTNYTMKDRHYRLRAEVGVVYSADMQQVREVLEKAANQIEWRDSTRKPRILLRRFGSSSVDWEVSVWITDPWTSQQRMSELFEVVWWSLKEAGITIAFPQLDVHFDTSVMDVLHKKKFSRDRSHESSSRI